MDRPPSRLRTRAVPLALALLLPVGWGCTDSGSADLPMTRADAVVDAAPASSIELPVPLPPLSPGVLHLSDLVPAPDGWWALDRRRHRIHRLDPDFQPRFSVGGRGEAPGEFLGPLALSTRGDTLTLLASDEHPVLHHFDLDSGDYLDRSPVLVPGCASFRARDILPHPDGGHLLGGICMRTTPTPSMGPGVVHVREGQLPLLAWSLLEPFTPDRGAPDMAILGRMGDEFRVARISDPCFHRIHLGDPPEGSAGDPPAHDALCPDQWTAVRLPLREMAESMGALGRSDALPAILGNLERLPALDRSFPHPQGILIRRLSGLESRELVLLRPDGTTETLLGGLPETSYVVGDQVVVGWEALEGIHVETRPLPAPRGGAVGGGG